MMPAFRARALFRNGIKKPEDILVKGKQKLLEILLGIMPFESDDPLLANSSNKHPSFSSSSSSSSSSASSSVPANNLPERCKLSCERLAESIIKQVRVHLEEEQDSYETIHNMSLAVITANTTHATGTGTTTTMYIHKST